MLILQKTYKTSFVQLYSDNIVNQFKSCRINVQIYIRTKGYGFRRDSKYACT